MKKAFIGLLAVMMVFTLAGCGNANSTATESGNTGTGENIAAAPESTAPAVSSESSEEPLSHGPLVRLTFEGGEAMMRLTDNAATQSFAAQLPMTQTFEDFNNIEKICRLPGDLTTQGVSIGADPTVADVTLYVPWNTLVFYYEDYGYNDDLIPMGCVESGMELLTAMGDEFEVSMELVDEDTAKAQPTETTDITMTVGDTVITATLDNSETTQAFLSTLPRTLSMNEYDGREYYGRIGSLTENGEAIQNFENGDVTYFPSGPSLAIFYDGADNSNQDGLIRMGKVTSDLSAFEALNNTAEMLIEIAE